VLQSLRSGRQFPLGYTLLVLYI